MPKTLLYNKLIGGGRAFILLLALVLSLIAVSCSAASEGRLASVRITLADGKTIAPDGLSGIDRYRVTIAGVSASAGPVELVAGEAVLDGLVPGAYSFTLEGLSQGAVITRDVSEHTLDAGENTVTLSARTLAEGYGSAEVTITGTASSGALIRTRGSALPSIPLPPSPLF